MDRPPPNQRVRGPRARPIARQNNNNNVEDNTAAVNEPTRRRPIQRRQITTNNAPARVVPQRPVQIVRRPTPPVRHADSDEDNVINLITPPRPRLVQQEREHETFFDLDLSSDEDEDEGLNYYHTHVIDDDEDSGDMNTIFNTLQAEEHAETEQERLDREYARRLQFEENMFSNFHQRLIQQRTAGMPVPIHRHFGEPRDEQIAQRAQQQELQEQTIQMARRRIEQMLLARHMPLEQRQRLFGAAGNANPAPRSLMGLHFVDRDFDERDYEMLLQLDENLPNRKMADAKLVEKIPVKTVKAGEKFDRCSVCLCDLEEGDTRRELPCTHSFHKDCIDKWLKDYKETCPICKQSLSEMEQLSQKEKKKKRKICDLPESKRKKRKIGEKNEQ